MYHIINWFFVLLILTISLSYWFYFKVKRDVYINDCQDLRNNGAMPFNDTYTPVVVPGKNILAGGSDKSHCISLVNKLVIASGVVTFLANMIQVQVLFRAPIVSKLLILWYSCTLQAVSERTHSVSIGNTFINACKHKMWMN